MVVGIPCGEVSDIYNSGGWKVSVGTDPKSGINGFKIDDINGFGESSGYEEFIIEYTVCNTGEECIDSSPVPLVAFKYGTCLLAESAEQTVSSTAVAYPNPVTDYLKINYTSAFDQKVRVEIIDPTGNLSQVIYTGGVHSGEENTWIWKPVSYVSGMYTYRIIGDKDKKVGKVMLLK
ncbi:MAG: T9SS type A sorting domain-containing protein [Cyclobacteriaceae bacterium]